jgi:CASPASE and TPR Repeat-Associated N-terminal domain
LSGKQERTMTELPSLDVALVIHCFAPAEGPAAGEAYEQLRRAWAGCREQMGMTEPIAGLPVSAVLPKTREELPAGELIAAAENPLLVQQAVLRRALNVLNLSVLLTPEGRRSVSPDRPAQALPVSHFHPACDGFVTV